MPIKTTYSIPAVWQPDKEGAAFKQLATGGPEISNLKLVSGGSAAHVDLYDWVDNGTHSPDPTSLVWVMDCSTTTIDSQSFNYGLAFKKGVFGVLTAGSGGNPQLCISSIPSQV